MKGKKLGGVFFLVLITFIFAFFGIRWIHYRLTHAITNAVFVESDTFAKVAYKRVAGRITKLYKEEGDPVEKGEPLAKIDDRDYRIKLEELKENIGRLLKEREALLIKRNTLKEELLERIKIVDIEAEGVKKRIESLEVRIDQLRKDKSRLESLFEKGVVPSRRFEEIDTRLRTVQKEREALLQEYRAVLAEKKVLKVKLKQIGELDKKIEALEKQIKALEKQKEDIENLVEETVLRSPIKGFVVKRYVSVGEVVRQGQFVYAVYDPEDVYILVLLEETKLDGVREGNRVHIKIDAYSDVEFEGVVKEIGRAAAAKFAIIPRDITAGEFTKVAQRIPIRVEITKGDKRLLRIGMGGEVAIEKTR